MSSVIEVFGETGQPLAIEVNIGTFLALLFKCGFTPERLASELAQFKAVVRSEVADRVHVRTIDQPQLLGDVLLSYVGADQLNELCDRIMAASTGLPTSSSREDVQFLLLWRWVHGLPPIKTAELAAQCGASSPTVSAAIKALPERDVLRTRDRQVALKGFSPEAWQKWLSASAQASTVRFVDRSGAPRSPDKLARTLSAMDLKDVAIGGVLGAMHHDPALDITGAPRLDLLIHGTPHADLSFIERLDPGLVREEAATGHAHVVVHFTNRRASHFEVQEGRLWADGLDCLVQLWQAGLTHQVEDLISHLTRQAKQPRECSHG